MLDKYKKTLVVVAADSVAQFYLVHDIKQIKPLEVLEHPAGRLRNNQLTTKEHDVNTCPYEDKNSKKTHEKQVFTKDIVLRTEKLMQEQGAVDLFMFAPPKMLGDMNNHNLKKHCNVIEISKDLVNLPTEKLYSVIQDHVLKQS